MICKPWHLATLFLRTPSSSFNSLEGSLRELCSTFNSQGLRMWFLAAQHTPPFIYKSLFLLSKNFQGIVTVMSRDAHSKQLEPVLLPCRQSPGRDGLSSPRPLTALCTGSHPKSSLNLKDLTSNLHHETKHLKQAFQIPSSSPQFDPPSSHSRTR